MLMFLPLPGERPEDYHWDVTRNLVLPGRRELWIYMTRSGAGGLFNARIPLELCVTIGHSMLGTHQFLYVASRPLANASL